MRVKKIDIFVPIYNEKENIGRLFDKFANIIHINFDVIVVYDFDEDNTLPVISRIKNNYSFNIRLIKNKYGCGANEAFRTGMESVTNDCVVFVMADISDSIETIDSMVHEIENGYDVVVGSRYMKGGRKIGGPFLKTLLSRSAGIIMKLLIGIPTYDISNGFKMYRKQVVESIVLESRKGFEIGLELTIKAYLQGYKFKEIPATWTDRDKGSSHFKMWTWLPLYLHWCFYAMWRHLVHREPKKR